MLKNHLISRVLSLLILLGTVTPLVHAGEPAFLRESIRARGMGNAFTAVANDEMVLYYNPAGLRSVQYNVYEILNYNLTNNTQVNAPFISGHGTIDPDNVNLDEGGFGNIAGKKIFIETNLGGISHVNSRFGWSIFGGLLVDLSIHNPVFPYFDSKIYFQGGAITGIAWSFLDYQLDVGVGGKIVQRAGVDTELHLTSEPVIEVANGNISEAVSKAIDLGDNKLAFAPDIGLVYHLDGIHNLSPKIALSVQNIGGLDFGKVGKVPMAINTGIATESELQGFDIILAADYHDLLDGHKLASDGNTLTERNFKLGLEVGWNRLFNGHHLFSYRLGRDGPYNSQGVSLNLLGFKLDLAKYSKEVGGYAGELEDKRWSFQLGLLF